MNHLFIAWQQALLEDSAALRTFPRRIIGYVNTSGTMLEELSIGDRYHMLDHRFHTRAELLEVGSALAQGDPMIRPGWSIDGVQVLAIVFPKANGTDQVVAAFRKRDEVTTRTKIPRRRISRLVPDEIVRNLTKFLAGSFAFLAHIASGLIGLYNVPTLAPIPVDTPSSAFLRRRRILGG